MYRASASCHVGIGVIAVSFAFDNAANLDARRAAARRRQAPASAARRAPGPAAWPPRAPARATCSSRFRRSDTGRAFHASPAPSLRGHVEHIAWRRGPIRKHARLTPFDDGVHDAIDRAFGRRAAEQAGDAQHVPPRRFEREPFAQQLRRGVHACAGSARPLRCRDAWPDRRTRNRCCSAPASHRARSLPSPARGRQTR